MQKKQVIVIMTSVFYLYLKLVPKNLFGRTSQSEIFCK